MINRDGIVIRTVAEAREITPQVFAAVDAEAKRAEWLKIKQGKLGASSAWKFWTPTFKLATNDGLQKYLKLKAAECDGLQRGQINGGAVRHGNDEETPGAIDFVARTGLVLTHYGDEQEWIPWNENDQVGCTPDGLITCDYIHPTMKVVLKNSLLVFEQKNNDTIGAYEEFAAMESGEDLKVADYKYWTQIQHQMMCTGAVAGVFQARYTRHESGEAQMCWFIVPRDDAFIAQHATRLHQAVHERDAYRKKRAGRKLIDLKQFIKQ